MWAFTAILKDSWTSTGLGSFLHCAKMCLPSETRRPMMSNVGSVRPVAWSAPLRVDRFRPLF